MTESMWIIQALNLKTQILARLHFGLWPNTSVHKINVDTVDMVNMVDAYFSDIGLKCVITIGVIITIMERKLNDMVKYWKMAMHLQKQLNILKKLLPDRVSATWQNTPILRLPASALTLNHSLNFTSVCIYACLPTDRILSCWCIPIILLIVTIMTVHSSVIPMFLAVCCHSALQPTALRGLACIQCEAAQFDIIFILSYSAC